MMRDSVVLYSGKDLQSEWRRNFIKEEDFSVRKVSHTESEGERQRKISWSKTFGVWCKQCTHEDEGSGSRALLITNVKHAMSFTKQTHAKLSPRTRVDIAHPGEEKR